VRKLNKILIPKSLNNLYGGNYKKAFRYLNWSDSLGNLVGSPSKSSSVSTYERLELNFLTHNFQYVIDNIEVPINAIEKRKHIEQLNWSEGDVNYLKVLNYHILLMTYTLLDDGNKMEEIVDIIASLNVEGVSDRIVKGYPAYTKERLENLFSSEPYYAQNYSEEILGNVSQIAEWLWGR